MVVRKVPVASTGKLNCMIVRKVPVVSTGKLVLVVDALLPCHALLRHLTTMQLFMGRFFFGGFGPQKTVDTKVKLVISLSFCSTALKL